MQKIQIIRQWVLIPVIILLSLFACAQEGVIGQELPASDAEKEVQRLLQQAQRLAGENNYDAAIPLAEKALTIAEKALGTDDFFTAHALTNLAYLYVQKGAYEKAEALYQRALAIGEKQLGPEHLAVSGILGNFAELYKAKKDYGKAEELYTRALANAEKQTGLKAEGALAALLHGLADVYFGKDEYDKAEPLYKRALLLREKTEGAEHPAVVAVLQRLAHIYNQKGEYEQAELFARRKLAVVEKTLGPEHIDVAGTLSVLVNILIKKKEYDRADSLLQRMFVIVEKKSVQDPKSLPLSSMLAGYAYMYEKEGQYKRAESLYQRALAVAEKSGRPQHPDVTTYLYSLAKLYEEKREYDRAEQLYRRAMGIAEKAVGVEHEDVADFLDNLASLYDKQVDYDKAEALYRRALSIREKALGTEHINVAYTLSNLAWIYIKKGEHEKAELLFKRALSISEKAVGQEHDAVAAALHDLAYIHLYVKQNYDQAELLYGRALSIREKELGKEHLRLVPTLDSLAYSYRKKGEYEKAEQLYRRALKIQEKQPGPKHPDVALTLNSLAWMYDEQGDYAKVEPLFQRALTIREEALGREHPVVASSLNIIAGMYKDRGDYERAEPLYQRALAIQEKALGIDHPDVADTLDSLAWIYFVRNDFMRAEQLSKRALKIIENKLGADHPNIASVLNQLALIYKGQGDFGKAEPLYQRALKINEKAYGLDHPFITQSLHNLALLYIAKGDFAKAEAFLLRSLAIDEKDGPMSADLAEKLTSLAYLYAAKGDIQKAVAALVRGTEITERHIGTMLATATGTEEQKRALLAMRGVIYETHGAVSLHMQLAPNDPQAANLALTTILRRKGRVLDAVSESMRALRRRLNPEDRVVLDQLSTVRSKLAAFVLSGPGKMDSVQYRTEVTRLEEQSRNIEAAVSARSAEAGMDLQPVTLALLQKAIPTDAALVEIVSYRPFNLLYKKDSKMWGEWRYAAYVLRHEGVPAWVDLGDAAQIDGEIGKLRASLSDPRSKNVKEAARSLDERVMRPVRKLLGDTKHIFISPDGALNLVPVAALVNEQGRYLVEDYTITYLTSGRDLLRLQVSGESKGSPVVVANPLFDSQQPGSNPQTARTNESATGRRSGEMGQMYFKPLPGTAGEAKALGEILPQVKMLTGAQATEIALKQVSAPRVLHVATHGFFLPDQKQEAAEGARGLGLAVGEARRTAPRIENPLLRSGLALAGANARQSADSEDGVLTALEAAGMNLWGTKLVVLLACETGVGRASNGNGVYGLRRALVLAGSESQVMSLWQVSDEATRDLMISYYKRLMAGEGRTEALRQVQLEVIGSEEQVAGGQSRELGGKVSSKSVNRSHPYFWAAFIQSGDWRGMDDKRTDSK